MSKLRKSSSYSISQEIRIYQVADRVIPLSPTFRRSCVKGFKRIDKFSGGGASNIKHITAQDELGNVGEPELGSSPSMFLFGRSSQVFKHM